MPTPLNARWSRRAVALTVLVLAAGGCSSDPASTPASEATAEAVDLPVQPLNLREVPAPSLEGNLLGDPTEREVWVYLPPQYFASEDPLPVVYYLPGFGEELVVGVDMPADLDEAFASIDPMIVVVVPGVTSVGGSFYVDSPANGDWESFVTQDVVEYVDASFRTLADAGSRGIAGFSMGGFGALNLGMRHPEVFGAVYATAPGLLDEGGLTEMDLFAFDNQIGATLDTLEAAESLEGAALGEALGSSPRQFDLAYGLAFAPATEPPYLVYPFTRTGDVLTRDDDVWATWEAGFGDWDLKVAEFEDNLAGLSGLGFDCAGDDDYAWIPDGCVRLDAQLTAAEIDHQYAVTSGGHEGGSGPQIVGALLPFMADHLVDEPTG